MKKLTKIFASVLTLALAMSTVVVPITAEAAYETAHLNLSFSNEADAVKISDPEKPEEATVICDGFDGKDETDKVGKFNAGTTYRGYLPGAGLESSENVMTYEAQVYLDGTKRIAHVYNAGTLTHRLAMHFRTDGTVVAGTTLGLDSDIWTSINGAAVHGEYVKNAWNKFAIEWNAAECNVNFYLNGELIFTEEITKETSRTTFNSQFAFEGAKGLYIDNMRIYPATYDVEGDKMPEQATGLTFLEGTMTVADAKALALDTQAGGPAAVKVYKDAVGGTEAADTETLGKDWYVVITSKSGDLYREDGVYKVGAALDCTGVTYADSTVTATVVNNTGTPIESMMMVLVEDGGKFIMSSAVQTGIEDSATFTIPGVDSLSNAEVFFVESWDDLAPVLDSTFDVE